ncbi:Alpha/Beta hydrolase protein [Talaromyces proteolyticus]|uniref:Alpha/Beta hydrolase protein n=1 Tax=Talaromyces proteolyticus TaxID=1131652 RepID=A0AAD4KG44_9EURO|nr:Alpha/Beta hydrolase protein [Talaromyces proteolyticus]KAH8689561.1 Alpha/Beta hydrolase protein [Talaromyces proteolyticus]
MAGVSKACCSIPPVVSKGYQEKGEYKTIGGLKTYVTGPADATRAILVIYDIFGYWPQTLQGADILATSDPDQKYRVFIPDFFEGEPADISWYPPTTDEHKQKLGNFFATKAGPPATLSKIPGVVADANKTATTGGGYSAWGILGYCWGGKVANLTLGKENSVFKAGAQAHPAMLDPADAKNVHVPIALLASKDEDPEAVKGYEQNLTVAKLVETFPTQIHGWMAARANLDDPEVRKEYERGYKTVLDFFHQHL